MRVIIRFSGVPWRWSLQRAGVRLGICSTGGDRGPGREDLGGCPGAGTKLCFFTWSSTNESMAIVIQTFKDRRRKISPDRGTLEGERLCLWAQPSHKMYSKSCTVAYREVCCKVESRNTWSRTEWSICDSEIMIPSRPTCSC